MRLPLLSKQYQCNRSLLTLAILMSICMVASAQITVEEPDTTRLTNVPPPPVVEEIFKVRKYPQANVSLSDFAELLAELDATRASRLVPLDEFLAMSAEDSTIVLDACSRQMFSGRHLDIAANLPYTEFTEEALKQIIPTHTTRVLIYCNNNFGDDDQFFRSKSMSGFRRADGTEVPERLLALNIPTHVTLLGYGYTEVYELSEFVPVAASELRGRWRGTGVD